MCDPQMNVLKKQLLMIIEHIEDKQDVIYIDYPLHHNVGDLLIYHGALSFFHDNNVKIKCQRSVHDFSVAEIKKIVTPKTTLICHGGGNFGDIYPVHERLRELIISSFPENRVIILPQTSHFSNDSELVKSVGIFRMHKKLSMFARDAQTLKTFKLLTDNSYLMPDMAHHLYGKLTLSTKPKKELLYFLRTDSEVNKSQTKLSIPENTRAIDWDDFLTAKDKMRRGIIERIIRIGNKTKSKLIKDFASYLWYKHSQLLINKSANYFSSYENVITSRMHGHILACLVNVNSQLIDNSYGKNSGYFDQWTHKVNGAQLYREDE